MIRHTTPDIAKGICYGQSDIDITVDFEKECAAIHEQVAITADTRIFSSPLLRCRKLAATFGKEVCLDARLMELNFGHWEMKAWTALDKEETAPWMQHYDVAAVPGGESYPTLQSRVLSFFEEMLRQSLNTAFVVTHAGPIRALTSHLLQMTLKDSFRIQLQYGHVLKLELHDSRFVITKGLVLQ